MDVVSNSDKQLIRDLARQVVELAARPSEAAKIAEWKRHNRFERGRPLVVVRLEDVWDEFVPAGSLQCDSTDARAVERILRQRLYGAEHIRDDTPVDGGWDVWLRVTDPGYGVAENLQDMHLDAQGQRTGARYAKAIPDGADPEKVIGPRELIIDREGTQREFEWACDLLGDAMPVAVRGKQGFFFTPVDTLAILRGLEQFFVDMLDEPKWVHELLQRMTDSDMYYLRRAEEEGAIDLNNGDHGLAGGSEDLTDRLPAEGYEGKPRLKDIWGLGAAQVFSEVSPAMHEEFAAPYEAPPLSLFGLNLYGCCEPLHDKVDIIRKLPNIHRISMSPWADPVKGAEALGREFIYNGKPNPAYLQGNTWDIAPAREEMIRILEATRANDCQLELVLNGTLTCRGEPHRYDEWTDLAMQLTQEYA